jgi:general secretion pathway protein N
MRVRLPIRHGVFLGVALLVLLIATLPLRVATGWLKLDEAGLSAREVHGSVWAGRLTEARLGPLVLGDVSAGLSPLSLLAGKARVSLSRGDEMRGAITLSRRSFGIDDVTATLPANAMFAPLPIASLELADVSARFSDGQCDRAEGTVRATMSGAIAGIDLAQGLSGTARCEGGALLLPLASGSAREGLSLRIDADGGFEAVLSVRSDDPAVAARLAAAGFAGSGGSYRLTIAGTF